jgi:hypothetical protein
MRRPMEATRVALVLLAGGCAAAASPPIPVAGTVPHAEAPPDRVLDPTPAEEGRPDLARRPYTAEQVRAGMPAGTVLRTVVEPSGKPPTVRVMTVLEHTETGAVMENRSEDGAGKALVPPMRKEMPWEKLRDLSSYPLAKTTIAETVLETPAGRFDAWLYTVRDTVSGEGGGVSRIWFARDLPGPPLRTERESGGKRFLRAVLVERRSPPSAE